MILADPCKRVIWLSKGSQPTQVENSCSRAKDPGKHPVSVSALLPLALLNA